MLMLVFFSILLFNWKMTKGKIIESPALITDKTVAAMGISMFGFYFGFVAVSLSLTYRWLTCPIEFTV